MAGMEKRVGELERRANDHTTELAVVKVEIKNLVAAMQENTRTMQALTNTLSYNKGLIVASAKWAAFLTLLIGAAWSAGTWVAGFLRGQHQ